MQQTQRALISSSQIAGGFKWVTFDGPDEGTQILVFVYLSVQDPFEYRPGISTSMQYITNLRGRDHSASLEVSHSSRDSERSTYEYHEKQTS